MTFEAWLQSRLTAHGFSPGPVDGKVGALTASALRAFQTKHDLAPTGRPDQQTVNALRASATAMTPAEMALAPSRAINEASPLNTTSPWPRQSNVRTIFGGVGERQTTIEIPYAMCLAWDKTATVRKMTVHELVAPSVLRVLEKVEGMYSVRERREIGLDIFGGALNVRRMRGGTSYSMHAWGIALDFDPERNQLKWGKDKARLAQDDARPFWNAWEDEGWVSLGRARNFDWMHVQAARL